MTLLVRHVCFFFNVSPVVVLVNDCINFMYTLQQAKIPDLNVVLSFSACVDEISGF